MFILTKEENPESGAYATLDNDGNTVIQLFLNKDDAITYNTLLEALDTRLHISETDEDTVEKICGSMGYSYNIVQPGEIVLPRMETLFNDLL